MNRASLVDLIRKKGSFLCVGLDTDPSKLPVSLQSDADGVLEFNRAIIEATLPFAVSYKLNIAFYEAMGAAGWGVLEETIACIPKGEALVIADAKRGDIGNTATQYGNAFFKTLSCDAITINPYMGRDSVEPFLDHPGKWAIVLGLTSNPGAHDVELLKLANGRYVFEEVIDRMAGLGSASNMMFVVGATQKAWFERIRTIIPDHFLLVPGVGAQGGDLDDLKLLMNSDVGLLVNSSRSIIYASSGDDFAEKAGIEAELLQSKMRKMIVA